MPANTELVIEDALDIEQEFSEDALAEMFKPAVGTRKFIWLTGPTFRQPCDKMAVGSLSRGWKYFLYQQNFPRRKVVLRGYWNSWWMKVVTDDQGNRDVWISAVFCRDGANGKPVPGVEYR